MAGIRWSWKAGCFCKWGILLVYSWPNHSEISGAVTLSAKWSQLRGNTAHLGSSVLEPPKPEREREEARWERRWYPGMRSVMMTTGSRQYPVPRATREKEEGSFHHKNMVFLEKVWLGPRVVVMLTPCSALADPRCAVSQGHQHQDDKARCFWLQVLRCAT